MNLIMKNHQPRPTYGTFYKITGLQSTKLQVYKRQKLRDLFQVKGDKETCQMTAASELGFSFVTKDIVGATGEIKIRCTA